eukprot:7379629-Prymnesium_polylepis.1
MRQTNRHLSWWANRQLKRRQQRQQARSQNSSVTGLTNETSTTFNQSAVPAINSDTNSTLLGPTRASDRRHRRPVSEQVAARTRYAAIQSARAVRIAARRRSQSHAAAGEPD